MRSPWKSGLLAAIVGAALLAVTSSASAQFGYYRPGSGYGSGYPMNNSGGPATAPLYSGAPATNPYASASLVNTPASPTVQVGDPYLNPYTSNPYSTMYSPAGGYLSGKADLVTARANAAVTEQRAWLVQEEVTRSRLDTRRKLWEEARYERAMLLNSQQLYEQNIQDALQCARHQPPLAEIRSGQSLNNLYNFLSAQQGKGVQGPAIPINEDVLKHINLSTGQGANPGLLKKELVWPVPLNRSEFTETRKMLDDQIQAAVARAKFGDAVGPNAVADIKNNIQKMQDVKGLVNEMQPSDYVEAKKFLNMLDNAAKALGDPNVSNYFGNNKWAAKGKTVSELVKNMTEQGLQFAPSTPGDEWAYQALYNAMRDYDANVVQLVGGSSGSR